MGKWHNERTNERTNKQTNMSSGIIRAKNLATDGCLVTIPMRNVESWSCDENKPIVISLTSGNVLFAFDKLSHNEIIQMPMRDQAAVRKELLNIRQEIGEQLTKSLGGTSVDIQLGWGKWNQFYCYIFSEKLLRGWIDSSIRALERVKKEYHLPVSEEKKQDLYNQFTSAVDGLVRPVTGNYYVWSYFGLYVLKQDALSEMTHVSNALFPYPELSKFLEEDNDEEEID
jgi:hypothetical protein